jgi:hypothetical protein
MRGRYRIIEHEDCFGLHEVRYTSDGSISSYNSEAIFIWEKGGSIQTVLMQAAAGLPILQCANLPAKK